jgi:7-cyano-7-deazaguanine synthase in queuosine biosynthesis
MKKVAVLFSGGLDSTYLIWKNLKDGNQVFPIYVEIQNNETKTILEKNRTELLFREFSKEFNSPEKYIRQIHEIHHAISVGVRAYESSLYFWSIF